MRTIVIGCNHRTASLEVRERLAFDRAACAEALRQLRQTWPCCEGALLSTCNRTELYLARPVHSHPRIDEAIQFLARCAGVAAHEFGHSLYHHEDAEALRHLFRVAGSLDSMVLGESQIVSQVKEAHAIGRDVGTVGRTLEAAFQRALAVAKSIHTDTQVSAGATSVGGTAVEFARRIFARFDDKTVLMIGAGEMGELTLEYLLQLSPRRVLLANRTRERAEAVVRRIGVRNGATTEIVPFDRLVDHLVEADIVLSTTGAPEPILRAAGVADLPDRRRYRPLLMIDIAVPRDIDPDVGRLENVFLYNIDDLQSVAEANVAARESQIARCHEIVEQHLREFLEWQRSRDVGPTIAALQRLFRRVGSDELAHVLPKIKSLSTDDRRLLEQMLHRIVQKLLHQPSTTLRDKAAQGSARVYAEALRTLFGLRDEE